MPVIPNNVIRAQVIIQTPNRVTHNVLYYDATEVDVDGQPKMQTIANAIDAAFRDKWLACISSASAFRGVLCYFTNAGDVFFEAMSEGGDAPGTGNTDTTDAELTLPDETVVTIRKLTGRGGREDRGRLFLSGIPEGASFAGKMHEDFIGPFQALADQVPTDIDVAGALLHARHWNRKENVMRPIVGAMVNSVLESRRDRRNPLRSVPIPAATGP